MSDYGTLNPYHPNYTGAVVSDAFKAAWLTKRFVGDLRPWGGVFIRRGYMHHRMHSEWPGANAPATIKDNNPPPFGKILGLPMYPQWYPDWTPTTDWIPLPGIAEIDIQQSVSYAGGSGGDGSGGAGGGSNGIAVATLTVENQAWVAAAGSLGAYHLKQRGWLWPWRGWVPTNRPGGEVLDKNQWFDMTPNAQILVLQGYGPETAVKTFTGLIDTIGPGSNRPDRISIVSRDFGSTLVDVNPFGYNKDTRLRDPMYFVPPDYPNLKKLKSKTHNWVIVNDATDIVRCALRWCGFKEWEIQDAGVQLKTAYLCDRSSTWMDVINEVASQLGYVFFIAEPTDDDLSIGVPVFRKQSVLLTNPPAPTMLDSNTLVDVQPTHDNSNDRAIIRVRGRVTTRKKGGRPIIGGDMTADGQVMYTAQYWPPWMPNMSGIVKQLTYYNQGSNGVLGFGSNQECEVAALLIAVQIAMGRDTATAEFPANPAIGLDAMTFINDLFGGSTIVSRLYVTGRQSTMTLGGDGTATTPTNTAASQNDLTWTHTVSGALCDNPEWDKLLGDYQDALNNIPVQSGGGNGQWS
jgi:hypothetical protein